MAAKAAEHRLLDMQDCWVGLALLKDIFHWAAEELIALRRLHGQGSTQQQLSKAMGALKAIRMGNLESFRKCTEAYPALLQYTSFTTGWGSVAWPLSATNVRALRQRVAELAEQDLKERIEHEVRSRDAEAKGPPKVNKVSMLVRIYKCWKSRKTMPSIGAVALPDGTVATNPDLMAKELTRHWQTIFSKSPSNPNGIDTFVREFMPAFPKINWNLSEEEFNETIAQTGNSAPGPDGIPYGCWRAAPAWARSVLFTCCSSWLAGAELPADFNWAYLALLPKVEKKHISAGETRPLSLGNTDAKLLASALQSRFAQGMDAYISKEQSGFMPGRTIVGSVATTEAAMIKASLTQSRAAALFFDFTAAFPSVSHTFLWSALRAAGIPTAIIRAIQTLYADNHHWVRLKGGTLRSVTIFSGVKQGCPLSPTLFILAGEAILQCLRQHLGPRDHISGYADDIAIVPQELFRTAPALASAFRRVAGVTGLDLNPRKCVMVPLWVRAPGRLRPFESLVPCWRAFQVADNAKYLGVHIGPAAQQCRWTAALNKFDDRVKTITSIGGGALFSSIFFRVYAASVFCYLMQFSACQGWVDVQARACSALFRGPYGWMPKGWFTAKLPLSPLPSVFCDLEVMHKATLMRTARLTFPGAQQLQTGLALVMNSDDAPLRHAWAPWHNSSIVSTLADAAQAARRILRDVPQPEDTSAQKHFSCVLEARRVLRPHPDQMWDRRLARWRALVDRPPGTHVFRGRAFSALQAISASPPSTRWSVIRMWLNGWCTARRFQRSAVCTFCGKMEDSIEHFARCPTIRKVGNSKLSLGLSAQDPLCFLLLDGKARSPSSWFRHAALVHAVFAAHNSCRHGTRPADMQEWLWAEARGVFMRHSSLQRLCDL